MMKKNIMTTVAALAVAVAVQTAAKAEDPISPVQGAVCNLYLMEVGDRHSYNESKTFVELAASMPRLPAVATFVDIAGDFKDAEKKEGCKSDAAMWTGWLKQEKAGTYTFLCKRNHGSTRNCYRYSIWINGTKCVEAVTGQNSFNVDLNAGFNSVKIITWAYGYDDVYPLSISYKKAGSVKEPVSFGPGDMWYDDED